MKAYRIELNTMEIKKSALKRHGYTTDTDDLRRYVCLTYTETAGDPTVLYTSPDLSSAKEMYSHEKTNVSRPSDMGSYIRVEILSLNEYDCSDEYDVFGFDFVGTVLEYTSMDASDDAGILPIHIYNAYVDLMDDDIREDVHADMAPCTNEEFLAEYQRRHLAKYGEELTI